MPIYTTIAVEKKVFHTAQGLIPVLCMDTIIIIYNK